MSYKMLSIIGLILILAGTAIATIVTIKYRTSSKDEREQLKSQNIEIKELNQKIDLTTLENNSLNKEVVSISNKNQTLSNEIKNLSLENKSLNQEIRSLSNRLGEQSKIIEDQITGGDSYIVSEFRTPDIQMGTKIYSLILENKFDNPIHNLEVHFFDVDKINSECLKEKNGIKFLLKDCYEKNQKIVKQGQVDPKTKVTLNSLNISDKDDSKYFNLTAFARNGTFQHKIYVDRLEGIIMGYVIQIEKDNKVIERYTKLYFPKTGYKIDESKLDFKENFTFIDSKTLIMRE